MKHPVGILFTKGLFCQQFLWDVKRYQGHVYKNGYVHTSKELLLLANKIAEYFLKKGFIQNIFIQIRQISS